MKYLFLVLFCSCAFHTKHTLQDQTVSFEKFENSTVYLRVFRLQNDGGKYVDFPANEIETVLKEEKIFKEILPRKRQALSRGLNDINSYEEVLKYTRNESEADYHLDVYLKSERKTYWAKSLINIFTLGIFPGIDDSRTYALFILRDKNKSIVKQLKTNDHFVSRFSFIAYKDMVYQDVNKVTKETYRLLVRDAFANF